MAEDTTKPGRRCIYCGGEVKKERRGEHIIPEAMGGELTLKEVSGKSVCQRYNSGLLSLLDRELCSRSFLSIIASQEIAENLWQVWDVDHAARNLLVEARPTWGDGELKRLTYYPQMTFEPRGPQLRGDVEEVQHFGREHFEKVIVRAVHRAFQKFNSGKKGALHLERARTNITFGGYRLAPRVFTTHTISEIAENIRDQSFILRYASAEDLRHALRSMDKLEVGSKRLFDRYTLMTGSRVPRISVNFDMGLTLRAMMKIGVNLLAAYCSKTVVNCNSFPAVTRLILGKVHPSPMQHAGSGFIQAADIQEIARPRCHTFRIVHLDGKWFVYSCFFGGRIGSVVSFPGPNREEWGTLDVVAPVHSKEWTVTKILLTLPIKVRVEWYDSKLISPSLKMQSTQSFLLVKEIPAKRS